MPNVNDRLRQVALKIKRAKEHVDDLENQLRAFFATNPYKVGTKRDAQTRQLIYYLTSVDPTPHSIPLIAGDAIQNLMSALDHLAYQIVCSDTHERPPNPNWIYFPIADDFTKYEAKKRGKMEGVSDDTLKAIDALKPYKGGNDLLWVLYRLNSVEKHRLLITAGSYFHSVNVGPRLIKNMARAIANSAIEVDPNTLPTINLWLEPADIMFPLAAGDQLFIDTPDSELNEKLQFRFDVAIREPGIIEDKPLLHTVHQLTTVVEGIVTALTPRLK